MKKTTKKLSAALGVASVAVALVGAVLYYVSLMSRFDMAIGHFASGATVTGFIVCLIASAILAIASGAVITRRGSITGSGIYSRFVVGTFVLLGALIMSSGVLNLAKVLPTFADSAFSKEHIIALVTPLFAIVGSVYFIMISGGEKTERTRAFLSAAAIVWALFNTLSVYFESGRPINSPIKALLLTTSLINMLFITEDARFVFRTQKAALYRAIAALCVCFGLVTSLPNVIVSILATAGVSSSALFDSQSGIFAAMRFDLLNSAIAVMISVCAAARLLTFDSCCGEYVKPKHEKSQKANETGDRTPDEN